MYTFARQHRRHSKNMYSIKELYYTIQGEGHHSGKPAVFLRFSGCNLWSGLEKDREHAICKFCDTDFWGTDGLNGGKYTAVELAETCIELWPKESAQSPFIVCTGGEPLLQLDTHLIDALHEKGFYLAIESNGTLPIPQNIDWVCISPKANAQLKVISGDELKVVYPQKGANLEVLSQYQFDHFFLQPMDNASQAENTKICIEHCLSHPQWKLSLQTHKLLGIP